MRRVFSQQKCVSALLTMTAHTLILIQTTENQSTRTYYDFETVREAMTGICSVYEGILKRQNSSAKRITYSVQDLLDWIDGMHDFCGLILNQKISAYVPHDRESLKRMLYTHLQKQAQ